MKLTLLTLTLILLPGCSFIADRFGGLSEKGLDASILYMCDMVRDKEKRAQFNTPEKEAAREKICGINQESPD